MRESILFVGFKKFFCSGCVYTSLCSQIICCVVPCVTVKWEKSCSFRFPFKELKVVKCSRRSETELLNPKSYFCTDKLKTTMDWRRRLDNYPQDIVLTSKVLLLHLFSFWDSINLRLYLFLSLLSREDNVSDEPFYTLGV